VILSEENISIEKIQSLFVDFLDGVLKEISFTYRFDYSHLDSNGIISTFNQPQPSGTEYRIRMDGLIYYFDEPPTDESLTQSLSIYFSFWGSSNLQDYLIRVGLEKADVVSVSIGGETITFVSNLLEEESQEVQEVQNIDSLIDNLSKPIVVILYTALILFAATVALLVFRHRIGRRRVTKRNVQIQSCENHSSENPNNDDDQEKEVTSKVPKTMPRKKIGESTSVSSRGVNASKELPMSMSENTPSGFENSAGRFGSCSSEIDESESPTKTSSLNMGMKKSKDAESDTQTCDLTNQNSSETPKLDQANDTMRKNEIG